MNQRDRNNAALLESAIYLKEYAKVIEAADPASNKIARVKKCAADIREVARVEFGSVSQR